MAGYEKPEQAVNTYRRMKKVLKECRGVEEELPDKEKKMELKEFFRDNPRVALAFSGGVDSAYLLYEAIQNGVQIGAYYVKSDFQPEFEYRDALRLARELGADLTVIEMNVLEEENVRSNPGNRCYYCKQRIFGRILQEAGKDGFSLIMDGTNASDDASDRPGMKALAELKVRSPLRECGLTKEEIRLRSRKAGLFTWNKPAYACLATRIETGEEITREKLTVTEQAETFLEQEGFRDFRVRLFAGCARIQVRREDLGLLLEKRQQILDVFSSMYKGVLLDLKPRDGE